MQKNDLLKCDGNIVRVLELRDDAALVIGCIEKSMPVWWDVFELNSYVSCSEDEMREATGMPLISLDNIPPSDKRTMHERYTLIAGILPFITDDKQRIAMTNFISEDKHVSKQTIRNYLRLFLIYQDIAVLAPKRKPKERPLTADEKNMRWALNKFFYTRRKNGLPTAYALMLKEKYCDPQGNLQSCYPSIHQFRHFYRKHKKMQTYYISRDGIKDYQRNNRPLLGDGVQEYASAVGVGMLDSTICDIYLVNEAGKLVGRPILTACMDAYSGLCCGYTLSWEGGVYSLRSLMTNVIADKVEWCRRFGIAIQRDAWNCDKLPATLVTDMGTEYKSYTFEQIAELGVTVVNLPSYRPELKGVVEKFFDLVQ